MFFTLQLEIAKFVDLTGEDVNLQPRMVSHWRLGPRGGNVLCLVFHLYDEIFYSSQYFFLNLIA
jgi:hypothetical protein